MRVLWISNIILPPICKKIGVSEPATGCWMYSSAKRIADSNIELAVASTYNGKDLIEETIDGIKYFLLPLNGKDNTKYNKSLEPYWQQVKEKFNPNIIHIHGTEFAHGLAYINACGADNVIVSIQGLTSIISKYYLTDIKVSEIIKNITIRDILRQDNLFQQKKKFNQRGEIEIKIIQSVGHIIGRTEWDKAHTWAINPNAQYHFCGETLRNSFYLKAKTWDFDKCEKQSIFLSQGYYPIKGLHKVIQALAIILRHYPETKLYVAGDDFVNKPFYRLCGYGKYTKDLLLKYNLSGKVIFPGALNEETMCQRYLKSNIFICPSIVENGSNALAEARILGVPYLASFAGGMPDMGVPMENFYQFEEVEMLARKVCSIFEKGQQAFCGETVTKYSPEENRLQLLQIYNNITNK